MYSVHEAQAPAVDRVIQALAARHRVPADQLSPALYHHEGVDAVRHLFKVASSLDSMVLGETQIIAQVKDAYQAALEAGSTGRVFNRLFQHALHVAKRVHTSTSLGEKNVSVPSVASRLAEKVFQDLARKRLVLIGAGEMGELTVAAFKNRGILEIHVVNRTLEHARALADRHGGKAYPLGDLPHILPRADILIACIRSDGGYVLTPEQVEEALRARRQNPIVLIDIAVPRNIHPAIKDIENAYLFDIDELDRIVQQNVVEREREVDRCMPLVEEETRIFLKEVTPGDMGALLLQMRETLQAIGEEEFQKSLPRLNGLSDDQKREVNDLQRRIINKILHSPAQTLRGGAFDGPAHTIIELVRKLFGINKLK
jgi:glutamyl-tRNA reductase